jgi:hypothetical protein
MPIPSSGQELIENIDYVLLGAFERHNFGDMLMGHIFEVLLERQGLRAVYASILENDLTSYGGNRVYSIFDLVNAGLDGNTPVVHVGGESVPCSFTDALLADSPLMLGRHRAEVVHRLQDHLATNRPFPYLTPPEEVVGTRTVVWTNRIFYGTGFTKQGIDKNMADLIKQSFRDSLFAGFRDRQSFGNAAQLDIKNLKLTPDIVLYISRLLPWKENSEPNYLLLHFNQNYLKMYERILVGQLEKISKNFDGSIKIALAGRLVGHDSVSAIHRFLAVAADSGLSIEFLPSEDIFDICRQISGARMVASTSLHYRIVAKSYGVPRISIDNPKVSHWSQSNDHACPYGVEPGSLAAAFTSLTRESSLLKSEQEMDIQSDIKMIDEYITEIGKIIHEAKPNLNGKALIIKSPSPPAPALGLWLSSLAMSLDAKERLLLQQEIQLSSRKFLLQSLIKLFTKPFAKNKKV